MPIENIKGTGAKDQPVPEDVDAMRRLAQESKSAGDHATGGSKTSGLSAMEALERKLAKSQITEEQFGRSLQGDPIWKEKAHDKVPKGWLSGKSKAPQVDSPTGRSEESGDETPTLQNLGPLGRGLDQRPKSPEMQESEIGAQNSLQSLNTERASITEKIRGLRRFEENAIKKDTNRWTERQKSYYESVRELNGIEGGKLSEVDLQYQEKRDRFTAQWINERSKLGLPGLKPGQDIKDALTDEYASIRAQSEELKARSTGSQNTDQKFLQQKIKELKDRKSEIDDKLAILKGKRPDTEAQPVGTNTLELRRPEGVEPSSRGDMARRLRTAQRIDTGKGQAATVESSRDSVAYTPVGQDIGIFNPAGMTENEKAGRLSQELREEIGPASSEGDSAGKSRQEIVSEKPSNREAQLSVLNKAFKRLASEKDVIQSQLATLDKDAKEFRQDIQRERGRWSTINNLEREYRGIRGRVQALEATVGEDDRLINDDATHYTALYNIQVRLDNNREQIQKGRERLGVIVGQLENMEPGLKNAQDIVGAIRELHENREKYMNTISNDFDKNIQQRRAELEAELRKNQEQQTLNRTEYSQLWNEPQRLQEQDMPMPETRESSEGE